MAKVQEATRMPSEQATDGLSEEQRMEIGRKAQKLIEHDPQIQGPCVTMLAAMQLYNTALQALNRRIDQQQEGAAVEKVLVESMKNAARKEFTRDDLLKKLQSIVLPFMMSEIQSANEREQAIVREQNELTEQQRAAYMIPLAEPFKLAGIEQIDRKRSLVLAGHSGAIRLLLDRCVENAMLIKDKPHAPKVVVIRLLDTMYTPRDVSRKSTHQQYSLKIGVNRWIHAAQSRDRFAKFMHTWLRMTSNNRCDLLIVDDLTNGFEPPYSSMAKPLIAVQAHRNIRRWADEQKCAVIAAVPLGTTPDVIPALPGQTSDWNQLEVYSQLQFVDAKKTSNNTYDVHVGFEQYAKVLADVPRSLIEGEQTT